MPYHFLKSQQILILVLLLTVHVGIYGGRSRVENTSEEGDRVLEMMQEHSKEITGQNLNWDTTEGSLVTDASLY